MKNHFQMKKMSRKSWKFFATFKEKAIPIKFHENSRIKMSRDFKVANCWERRKIRLKMYLIQQKSCNLLPQIRKKNKYIKIYGRWKVQKRAIVTLYRENQKKNPSCSFSSFKVFETDKSIFKWWAMIATGPEATTT